jgi:hypothetical protein
MAWMKPAHSPKDEIEHLRRTGDPRLSEAAKKLIREITAAPTSPGSWRRRPSTTRADQSPRPCAS